LIIFNFFSIFKEIASNLVNSLIAGFETTSSALTYSFLVLAHHPEELEKLQEEIDARFSSDSNFEITVDNVDDFEYLDMFVSEILRMFPIAFKYAALS
jgi:cytochrome P450